MNKRMRKKKGKVLDNELWNFDYTICKWMIPRLKRFKQINCAYPGIAPYDTPEKWDAALDQMIRSFELLQYDPLDLDENLNYVDYDPYNTKFNIDNYKVIYDKWKAETDKGLKIFAENFSHLWI